MTMGRFAPVLAAAAAISGMLAPAAAQRITSGRLTIRELSARSLSLAEAPVTAACRSPGGAAYLLERPKARLHVVDPEKGTQQHFDIGAIVPSFEQNQTKLISGLDIGPGETVYLPFAWRRAGTKPEFGVFILRSEGQFERLVLFRPPVEIRHIAIGEGGEIFVLGGDPDYFLGKRADCFLIHKYSAAGERISSFSPCPPGGERRRLAEFHRLRPEIEQGRLWVEDGSVFHLLPMSRRLRVHDSSGKLLENKQFQPPSSASAFLDEAGAGSRATDSDVIWRIVPLSKGKYLVQWTHSDHYGGGSIHKVPYLALHDASGNPLSDATRPPWPRSAPAFRASGSECYFLRSATAGRLDFVRARVEVEEN